MASRCTLTSSAAAAAAAAAAAGASRDPPEKQAPMCTLHSFPHNIHHCLTYARWVKAAGCRQQAAAAPVFAWWRCCPLHSPLLQLL